MKIKYKEQMECELKQFAVAHEAGKQWQLQSTGTITSKQRNFTRNYAKKTNWTENRRWQVLTR